MPDLQKFDTFGMAHMGQDGDHGILRITLFSFGPPGKLYQVVKAVRIERPFTEFSASIAYNNAAVPEFQIGFLDKPKASAEASQRIKLGEKLLEANRELRSQML